MTELARARQCLQQENHTCVLCRGTQFYKSDRRGVAPLLQWLDSGIDATGFCAADRVVGKATAFLYCLLGVSAVYAAVMSRPAAQVLESAGIAIEYDRLVEGILNRQKDGPCPMEAATRQLTQPRQALLAIRRTLQQLRKEEANGSQIS